MATFNHDRPFARILSSDPKSPAYEQDGVLFTGDYKEVGHTDGYEKAQAKLVKAPEPEVEDPMEDRAAAIIGNLGAALSNPQAEATRENAAAAQAEQLADDSTAGE